MTRRNLWAMMRSFTSPAKKAIAASTMSGLLRVGASLTFIAASKRLIDIATGYSDGSAILFSILMIVCIGAQLLFGSISTMVENRSEITLRNTLRSRLFMHIIKGHWIATAEYHSGDIVSRLTDDVTTVSNMICRDIPYTLITLFQLTGAIVFLMWLDIRLALLIIIIMPIAIIASRLYIHRMRSINVMLRSTESDLSVNIQDSVRNRALIKTMSGYQEAATEHNALSNNLSRLIIRRTRLSLYSKNLVQGGFACGYATAFLFGIYGMMNHSITFGMMTAFLQLVSQIQQPTLELSKIIPSMVRTITATERIGEIIDIPQEPDVKQIAISGKAGIRFSHVSFKYPKSDDFALTDLSCTIYGGTTTAIVGKSGVGKTTMFRLMMGLISPTGGNLTIYNESDEAIISEATRMNFSYVPQGNTLVSGTIRDNLLLGNPTADEEVISEAIKAACADFIYSLPEGLDFRCEEDGVGLSHGQAQRIAIARALIHHCSILLLDEPTSALDETTSKKLLNNLAHTQSGKTIIIITHSNEVADLCRFKIELS